jgi:hypothetical protein
MAGSKNDFPGLDELAGDFSRSVTARGVTDDSVTDSLLATRMRQVGKTVTDTVFRASPAAGEEKIIKDSFSAPESEHQIIKDMIFRAAGARCQLNKSDVVRLGLRLLVGLDDDAFMTQIESLPRSKRGARPK